MAEVATLAAALPALTARFVCGLAQQANEKIDHMRDVAATTLTSLLGRSELPAVPHADELRVLFCAPPAAEVEPAAGPAAAAGIAASAAAGEDAEHAQDANGRDARGQSRAEAAAAYPQPMCEAIAAGHEANGSPALAQLMRLVRA